MGWYPPLVRIIPSYFPLPLLRLLYRYAQKKRNRSHIGILGNLCNGALTPSDTWLWELSDGRNLTSDSSIRFLCVGVTGRRSFLPCSALHNCKGSLYGGERWCSTEAFFISHCQETKKKKARLEAAVLWQILDSVGEIHAPAPWRGGMGQAQDLSTM